MYTLLIVDDEWTIREGLEKTIPWEDWELQVIGTAKNGAEAAEHLSNNHIDVLLTDIRMPGISGLELIEDCKKKYPDLKIIILSGHDEFEYAQKAIKLGADDFLLKPTDVDELEKTFLRVVQALKSEHKTKEELISLTLKEYIQYRQVTQLTKLNTFKSLKPLFGIIMIKWDEPVEKRLTQPNCISIDKQDYKQVYLFHSIPNESQWESTVNEIKEELLLQNKGLTLSFSLLTPQLDQLITIHKQANVASMIYYKNDQVTMYKYRDEKYTLDLEDIIRYIDNHYMEQVSQSEMAKRIHMSTSYFSKLFKMHTGLNFVDYLTEKRMELAKDLLRTTSLKTYEVASEVGFVESRYFSQLFKKHVNCTPVEYRKKFSLNKE